MKDDSFVVILPFMVSELKLKGNELIIFAIINSFTAAEQSYTGSIQYLMEWTNSTKQGVMKALGSLKEKGLIQKEERWLNGIKFCEYTTGKQSLQRWSTEFTGVVNKVYKGGKQSLPNNKDNNKADNKDYKKERGFTPPTLEEVREYVSENNLNVDAEYFYKFFTEGNWVDSKGNKVRSWKQKLLTWSRHDSSKPKEQDYKDIGVVRE